MQRVKGALNLLHDIAECTDYWGCEELSLAVMKVPDILVDLRLKKKKKQSSILDSMEKRMNAKE